MFIPLPLLSKGKDVLAQVVTYSPAFTLVPTYECFNRCDYCNFRRDPYQSPWLSLADATTQLQALDSQGISEILVLSGEVHPQSSRRAAWASHLVQLCELALEMGFLPHTNAGPLSYGEMAQLRSVNVSMGLMLEQITPTLRQTVHRHAPSKDPVCRLQQLEWAGKLQIPFTTGLLLGLGEMEADRRETLLAIAHSHRRWGHIQEVILQPYRPGQQDSWAEHCFALDTLPDLVAIARRLLPPDITIQIPPNLIESPELLLACLEAGARDLGGLVPHDHVNPDYAHAAMSHLNHWLRSAGWQLQPRLPIYPDWDHWLPSSLQGIVQNWRSRLDKGYTVQKDTVVHAV